MKQKRRKKLAREWADFQERHGLSDECREQARALGHPPKRLEDMLVIPSSNDSPSVATQISELQLQRQEQRARHEAAIESGIIKRKPKKPKQKPAHDPQWAKAKQLCRLNMEDIRMAQELGMSPKTLMKNVPSAGQSWKAPVKTWIRELYEERQEKSKKKSASPPPAPAAAKPLIALNTHVGVIHNWEQNAERNEDENYEFLRSLKLRDYGFEPDELAGQLHQQIFQIVDCTRCANCCKTLQPELNDEDIERIAGHLQMEVNVFIETYLEADEYREYRTQTKPCPFLGDDDHCTIYEIRPQVCRGYPYTDKEGFVHRTRGVANNAEVCPAVFGIVEQMKHHAQQHDHNPTRQH